MKSGFFSSVYEVLLTVPRGKVVTYGQLARAVGAPRMARQVGYALHSNPKPGVIPCHRVASPSAACRLSKNFWKKKALR